MYDENYKHLILKFLRRHYPISRIKHGNKFKRGLVLDNGNVYLLSNPSHKVQLSFKLKNLITKIFNCDDDLSKTILDNFLNIK